ncbi:ER membrane glycoprotein subunit of the GPI transamidase complex-like protein [Dispira simplex]|nr:ER membrane glycoprotein subunit of the GPI transamidase complex-like protein [Dispira simplex]
MRDLANHHRQSWKVAKIALLSRLLVIILAFLSNVFVDDYDSSFDLIYQPTLPGLPVSSLGQTNEDTHTIKPLTLPRWDLDALEKPTDTVKRTRFPESVEPERQGTEIKLNMRDNRESDKGFIALERTNANGYDLSQVLQSMLRPWLRVFVRWDAIYFIHLAEEGHYVFEQEHAFFPMLPLLIRFVASSVLYPLIGLLGFRITIILAGVLVSNCSFVASAVALYHLGIDLLRDKRLAFLGALCYCFTPSNVFMSAIYTESLFALFSFISMRLVLQRRYLLTAYFICLGSLTRSNSIAYSGFFIYDLIVRPLQRLFHPVADDSVLRYARVRWLLMYSWNICRAVFFCAIALSGFILFQLYGYSLYCLGPQNQRPWCNSRIPLLYSFVQHYYWNNGFLKYYEWKQIPNFLFAGPMIYLSVWGIYTYARADWYRFFTLGVVTRCCSRVTPQKPSPKSNRSLRIRHPPASNTTFPTVHSSTYLSDALLPHIYLWAVLLVYAVFNMHIQVITRFFSSQPTVYWFSAYVFLSPSKPTAATSTPQSANGTLHHYARTDGTVPSCQKLKRATPSSLLKTVAMSSPAKTHPRCMALTSQGPSQTKFWNLPTQPLSSSLSTPATCLLYYYSFYGLIGIVLFSNFFPPA